MAETSTVRIVFRGDASDAAGAVAHLDRSFSALGRAAKAAAIAVGVGLATALGTATKWAVEFDREMRRVNSISKLSEAGFEDLKKSVLGLAKETGKAPSDLAKGLYDIVSSGFEANDAIKVLRASAKAASAGLTDTATATKAVAAALNAYHRRADDATDVSDVLFKTVEKGVLTFEELAQNMGDLVPAAAPLGVTLEEVGAAIATITLQGVPAAEAATRVKNVMLQLASPSKALGSLLREAGYASGEAAIQARGFVGVLELLNEATHGGVTASAALTPEIRALLGVVGLTGKNFETYTSNLKAMDQASQGAGATAAAFAEQAKSVSFQWQQAKASLIAASIPIGELMLPLLSKAAEATGALADAINRAMPTIRRVVEQTMLAIRAAWESHGRPAFAALRETGQSIVAWFQTNWPEIRRVVAAVAEYIRVNVVPLLQAAFQLVRAAAVVVVDAVRANWPQIRAIVSQVAEAIGPLLRHLASLMRVLAEVVEALGPVFRVAFGAALLAVRVQVTSMSIILKAVTVVINAVKSAVDALVGALESLASAIRSLPSLPSLSLPKLPDLNPFKQHGGPVAAGMPYIVGEAGPELFVPRLSGKIISNRALRSMQAAPGLRVPELAAAGPAAAPVMGVGGGGAQVNLTVALHGSISALDPYVDARVDRGVVRNVNVIQERIGRNAELRARGGGY